MPINVSCNCGRALRVKDESAGRRVKCPSCGAAVTVPMPASERPLAEPPDSPMSAMDLSSLADGEVVRKEPTKEPTPVRRVDAESPSRRNLFIGAGAGVGALILIVVIAVAMSGGGQPVPPAVSKVEPPAPKPRKPPAIVGFEPLPVDPNAREHEEKSKKTAPPAVKVEVIPPVRDPPPVIGDPPPVIDPNPVTKTDPVTVHPRDTLWRYTGITVSSQRGSRIVGVSHDRKLLATCAFGRTPGREYCLWDLKTGVRRAAWVDADFGALALAVAADGKRLYSMGRRKVGKGILLRAYDTSTGRADWTADVEDEADPTYLSMLLSPDESTIAIRGDAWHRFSTEDGRVGTPVGGISSAQCLRTGRVAIANDRSVRLHESLAKRDAGEATLDVPMYRPLGTRFSPDGSVLVIGGMREFLIVDAASAKPLRRVRHPSSLRIEHSRPHFDGAMMSADGRFIAIDHRIFDTVNETVRKLPELPLAMLPDGVVVTAPASGPLEFLHPRDGSKLPVPLAAALPPPPVFVKSDPKPLPSGTPNSLAGYVGGDLPDTESFEAFGDAAGKTVVTVAAPRNGDGIVTAWDVETGTRKWSVKSPVKPKSCALSPDGKWFVSLPQDHPLRVWDVAKGKVKFEKTKANSTFEALVFDSTGRFCQTESGRISVADGNFTRISFPFHKELTYEFATCSNDGVVRVKVERDRFKDREIQWAPNLAAAAAERFVPFARTNVARDFALHALLLPKTGRVALLLTVGTDKGRIDVHDPTGKKPVLTIPLRGRPHRIMKANADQTRIAVHTFRDEAGWIGAARIFTEMFDLATGEPVPFADGDELTFLTFLGDRALVLDQNVPTLFDAKTGARVPWPARR